MKKTNGKITTVHYSNVKNIIVSKDKVLLYNSINDFQEIKVREDDSIFVDTGKPDEIFHYKRVLHDKK